MTSGRLRRHLPLLKKLSKSNKSDRDRIITISDDEFIRSVCECAKNALNGNIRLTTKQKNRLRKNKGDIKLLANPRVSLNAKRRRIIQRGGFIGPLIGAALSVIPGLLGLTKR
jgi:hypothetical protein